jgi:hypothetical protein
MVEGSFLKQVHQSNSTMHDDMLSISSYITVQIDVESESVSDLTFPSRGTTMPI